MKKHRTLWNANKQEEWDNTSNWKSNHERNSGLIVQLTMDDILQLKHMPIRDTTGRAKYPAHEIHFVHPPSNHERDLVAQIFAGMFKDEDAPLLRADMLGIKIVKESSGHSTKMYEYIRTFNWFTWMRTSYANVSKRPQQGFRASKSRALKTYDWISLALSSLKSPEQLVRAHRDEIAHDWLEIYREMVSNRNIYLQPLNVAKLPNYEYEDVQIDPIQKSKIKTHYKALSEALDKVSKHTVEIVINEKERIGQLTQELDILRSKLKRQKQAEDFKKKSRNTQKQVLQSKMMKALAMLDNM